jgi:uncharacterized protein with NRDE domain
MCIAVLVINYSSKFPLIVAHNREEDMSRPTSDLVLRDGVLSAIDVKAGGVAAVGLDIMSGRFGMLTNCRVRASSHSDGMSRGSMLKEALKTGIDADMKNLIHSCVFQGPFHVYVGDAYVRENVGLDYCCSFAPENSRLMEFPVENSSPMEVIVRMNEHSSSEEDWIPKLHHVKQLIESELFNNPDCDSTDDLATLIEGCLSRSGNLSLQNPSLFGWSPAPSLEPIALNRILIPATDIATYIFGTVSQTIMITDRENSLVDYRFRKIESKVGCSDFGFRPWTKALVSFR